MMKNQYDLHRSTFSVKVRDFIYIGHPHSVVFRKLDPIFEGPYKVIKIQKHPGTEEVTRACVNIGYAECPLFGWYSRYKIRSV